MELYFSKLFTCKLYFPSGIAPAFNLAVKLMVCKAAGLMDFLPYLVLRAAMDFVAPLEGLEVLPLASEGVPAAFK